MKNKNGYYTIKLNQELYKLIVIMAYSKGLKIYTMVNELLFRGIKDMIKDNPSMNKYAKEMDKIDLSKIRHEIKQKIV